jgi:alkylation response protein AidB-like acyl-CoA dehydrogenase
MIGLDLSEDHLSVESLGARAGCERGGPTSPSMMPAHFFDRTILNKMSETGLLGICIPAEHGGAGFDYISGFGL